MSVIKYMDLYQSDSVSWFNLTSRKEKIPCPVCNSSLCYRHCNNCGKDIWFRKDEFGKSLCLESGTEIIHKCMKDGTRRGKFLDVNKKYNAGNFWRDHVVQEKDNAFVKQIKIDRWKKLVGWNGETTYAERTLVKS